ncbi:hypothetical protein B0G57_1202 [Trinickia symbiotica]|uniref:Uncharacterized protein n=1 Tax=Trinickia symbiotica TaxID=863227 RepID=A0A2N7WUX0_9BURK|nr:hypothetical protein [Trinickia symbiotica]PMS33197.1 hypothetical protein C0Z20_24620 [Trinickia symbiotica]PPK42210.1 hypothetical protein B0G57_1202 [Trinickia symbiotica]
MAKAASAQTSAALNPHVHFVEGVTWARVIASKTFPQGFEFSGWDFVGGIDDEDGDGKPYNAARIPAIKCLVHDSDGWRESEGALIALNLRPDSEAARNLAMIVHAEHIVTPESGITRIPASDRVSMNFVFGFDPIEADLSGGSLIARYTDERVDQFTFLFSDMWR